MQCCLKLQILCCVLLAMHRDGCAEMLCATLLLCMWIQFVCGGGYDFSFSRVFIIITDAYHHLLQPFSELCSVLRSYSVENTMVKTLKTYLAPDTFTDPQAKKKFLKASRQVFETKYKEREGQRWLFEKLRF